MKILFIESKRKFKDIDTSILNNLPKSKNIDLFYTIQYKELAEKIARNLGKRVKSIKQVLGCSKISSKNTILLISDGKFHASQLANFSEKEVYVFNGFKLNKIPASEIDLYLARKKAKTSKFFLSDEIGILVSTKQGQNRLKQALKLKNNIPQGKKAYIFISDNISIQELENFSLPIYINTSCPGLENDSNIVLNYYDIKKTF